MALPIGAAGARANCATSLMAGPLACEPAQVNPALLVCASSGKYSKRANLSQCLYNRNTKHPAQAAETSKANSSSSRLIANKTIRSGAEAVVVGALVAATSNSTRPTRGESISRASSEFASLRKTRATPISNVNSNSISLADSSSRSANQGPSKQAAPIKLHRNRLLLERAANADKIKGPQATPSASSRASARVSQARQRTICSKVVNSFEPAASTIGRAAAPNRQPSQRKFHQPAASVTNSRLRQGALAVRRQYRITPSQAVTSLTLFKHKPLAALRATELAPNNQLLSSSSTASFKQQQQRHVVSASLVRLNVSGVRFPTGKSSSIVPPKQTHSATSSNSSSVERQATSCASRSASSKFSLASSTSSLTSLAVVKRVKPSPPSQVGVCGGGSSSRRFSDCSGVSSLSGASESESASDSATGKISQTQTLTANNGRLATSQFKSEPATTGCYFENQTCQTRGTANGVNKIGDGNALPTSADNGKFTRAFGGSDRNGENALETASSDLLAIKFAFINENIQNNYSNLKHQTNCNKAAASGNSCERKSIINFSNTTSDDNSDKMMVLTNQQANGNNEQIVDDNKIINIKDIEEKDVLVERRKQVESVVDLNIPILTEPISDYYDLEVRPFARGKFAQVKRCTNKLTKQCFAAKCIKKRRRSQDVRHEILLEIEALKLSYFSERIIKLYQVFETPTEMILILEMALGGELQRLLDEEEKFDELLVKRMIRQILEGLILLHDNDIAHLDLKPQNLLLTKKVEPYNNEEGPEQQRQLQLQQQPQQDENDKIDMIGDVKLCDFGISRKISKDCEIREICGTPDYVAPEILRYDPISLATDMWSVGVLTYVLLSGGYSPFGSDNKQQTFCNITQSNLDFPQEMFAAVSTSALDFMQKLMVQKPADRLTSRQAIKHPWLIN